MERGQGGDAVAKSPQRRELSQTLRRRQTPAEALLWELVRNRRFEGLKFRRQHPVGRFIADFYCPERRVAIELDGAIHRNQEERDRARDQAIRYHGIRVMRLRNEDVLDRTEETLERLKAFLAETSASPQTAPPPLHLSDGEGARG